jgi:hypothetical protein
MFRMIACLSVIAINCSLLANELKMSSKAIIEFNKDVMPVLKEYCISCDGPDKKKG